MARRRPQTSGRGLVRSACIDVRVAPATCAQQMPGKFWDAPAPARVCPSPLTAFTASHRQRSNSIRPRSAPTRPGEEISAPSGHRRRRPGGRRSTAGRSSCRLSPSPAVAPFSELRLEHRRPRPADRGSARRPATRTARRRSRSRQCSAGVVHHRRGRAAASSGSTPRSMSEPDSIVAWAAINAFTISSWPCPSRAISGVAHPAEPAPSGRVVADVLLPGLPDPAPPPTGTATGVFDRGASRR